LYNEGQIDVLELAMEKSEFLDTLRKDREAWEALLARVNQDEMTEPVLPGGWSVKDIIAHVAWHEREMAGLLEGRALAGSDWWELPMDERNVMIFELYIDRPLDEVLEFAQQAYAHFLATFKPITNKELNDPARFEHMPPDWIPWKIIADNTYEHYRAHMPAIEEWLAAKGNS
jgi:hypothetical protein